MVVSKNLFELIKSLSASEKGYFRKRASLQIKGEETNYIKLFKEIDNQVIYDEAKLLKKFSGEKFIVNFSVAKNYLYELIMESLEAYHTDPDSQLRSTVRRLEILFQRGLYGHCEKLLMQAKKMARKHENYLQLIELLSIQVEIWYRRTFTERTEEEIKSLFDEIEQTVSFFNNHLQYRHLNAKLISLMVKSGPISDSKQEDIYNSLMQNPFLQSEKKALSLKAKLTYYNCLAFYYHAVNDVVNKLAVVREIDKLMGMDSRTIELHPYFYWTNVGNIIHCLGVLKRYDEMRSALDKMIQTKINIPELKAHQYFIHRNLLINMYTRTGKIREGINALKETDADIAQGKVILPSKYLYLIHLYYAAYHYFCAGDYKKSNALVQQILDEYSDDTGIDFQCFARILRLLIQFEMGKNELLAYTIKSAHRFIEKKKHMYKMEESLFRVLKRLATVFKTDKQKIESFVSLRNEIIAYSTDKYQARALDYFDLTSWLESKIQGRSFSEILLQNSGSKSF